MDCYKSACLAVLQIWLVDVKTVREGSRPSNSFLYALVCHSYSFYVAHQFSNYPSHQERARNCIYGADDSAIKASCIFTALKVGEVVAEGWQRRQKFATRSRGYRKPLKEFYLSKKPNSFAHRLGHRNNYGESLRLSSSQP